MRIGSSSRATSSRLAAIMSEQRATTRPMRDVELVCDVPATFAHEATGWPSNELLRACGGEFVEVGGARVVRFANRMYGDIVGNVALRMWLIDRR
jgi:hypothetical protein